VSGLRERKKQQTREAIAETARGLFVERGFEAVRVAEVARAADVSEKTVFNYFPTKEDLVFWRLEAFEAEILGAVRERAPGESALAAFRRFVLTPRGLIDEDDPAARELLHGITRMITSSPALVAREQQVFLAFTDSLARLLAEETGAAPGDIEPWVAANAMMGVHRALVRLSRERVLAGATTNELQGELTAAGERALQALEAGLGGYAIR
jgi:AcrR family transcriptional regulator